MVIIKTPLYNYFEVYGYLTCDPVVPLAHRVPTIAAFSLFLQCPAFFCLRTFTQKFSWHAVLFLLILPWLPPFYHSGLSLHDIPLERPCLTVQSKVASTSFSVKLCIALTTVIFSHLLSSSSSATHPTPSRPSCIQKNT